jgi:mono/diheme cytochrome c family protein
VIPQQQAASRCLSKPLHTLALQQSEESMHFRPRSLISLVLLAGCQFRPYEDDPLEVNARYAMKYQEPCSSWLRSPHTGFKYCASPAFTVVPPTVEKPQVAAVSYTPMASGPTDEASLMAQGEAVYGAICVTCHQANGLGVPGAFPPLAGSGSYYGDPRNHARIIVHGLSGTIQVQGATFNGAMPAQAQLSDYDVAAVATYERLSWGNNDGVVLPEDVAAIR